MTNDSPENHDDSDDIIYSEDPVLPEEIVPLQNSETEDSSHKPSPENTPLEDDIFEEILSGENKPEVAETPSGEIEFPVDKIDLRGHSQDHLINLLKSAEAEGASALDAQSRTVGTWENLIFRAILEPNYEEIRIQEALGALTDEEKKTLSSVYKDEEGKSLLKTGSIIKRIAEGETKSLVGDDALLAFEAQERGGVYRIPLYNSGITLDLMVPTGNDIQTLLSNCIAIDTQLGSTSGAHYFTYSDLMFKTQILNFLQPLIVGSSYNEYRKKGRLWSIVKLPDLPAIVATLAALCYKDGFEGFATKCTRPISEDHPTLCRHTEQITADIFKMIVTRHSVIPPENIKLLTQARMQSAKHPLAVIAKYQADLGFEGERITFDNFTFVMRVPTVAEHVAAGEVFISDIINEIEGDNTEGRYEQFGFRYIRTFLPWIASVEVTNNNRTARTSDARVIIRCLEKIDFKDEDDKVRDTFRHYINKTQLTYIGYPVTQCPSCKYVDDTPSGMWTLDPFSSFFTLAFLYSTEASA